MRCTTERGPDRITVFPNTIDMPAYRDAASRLRRRPRTHPSAARDRRRRRRRSAGRKADPAEGSGEICSRRSLARRRRPQRRLHLLFVGDGELRASLERRAAELAVDVTFTGFVQGDALLECYAAADIFALVSRREPWGVVVNEAAAFGLPLVLTDRVGAAADLLVPGENGELVRSGDVEQQAAALARPRRRSGAPRAVRPALARARRAVGLRAQRRDVCRTPSSGCR